MKRRIADKIAEYLEASGMVEIESPSQKFRRFKKKNEGRESFYWLGRKGAVRAGRTLSESISVTHLIKERMRARGLL